MKKIVISLATAVERRNHIVNEFAQKKVEFEFFDALTPEPALQLSQELNLNVDEKLLTKGELACFMSHVYLWKKMVDENLPYMVIFEDDIYLGSNVDDLLNDSAWINECWHLIKLEDFTAKVAIGKKIVTLNDAIHRSLYTLNSANLGTAGYILSLHGAKCLLNYIKTLDKLIALDHLMFEKLIDATIFTVYQMKPALCIQDVTLYSSKDSVKFASHLYKERLTRRKFSKRKGIHKIIFELIRIYYQLRNFIFYRKVGFK